MTSSSTKQVLLITGGHGMVGHNVRAHPSADRWQILAPTSSELNLRDGAALRRYIAEHKPSAVVHAAGVVGGIHANMAEPVRYLTANAEIGLNVVNTCIEANIGTLINLASSCMYPKDIGRDLVETDILTAPLEPTNEGYALAKIMTTRLCEFATHENPALHYKTLIPCNLYGPWDKFDPGVSHLVPAIIHKVHLAKVQNADEVEIWGDGEARREFMYAGDLADAVMRALDDPSVVPPVMNVGIGVDHSINEYYETVASVIGWSGRFIHDLSRPVGMQQKLMSVDRQTEWGWKARTSLTDGLQATYQFYLEEYAK